MIGSPTPTAQSGEESGAADFVGSVLLLDSLAPAPWYLARFWGSPPPATASAPYVVDALSFRISMLSMAAWGIEFKSTNITLTKPGLLPVGYGATRRPSIRMRVALASKPRSATVAAPTAVLEPFSLFEIGTTFAFTTGRLRRNCSVVCSPDLLMLSRLKSKTGFGPTSSAVGMFEPVTMTRSASAVAGAGAAPGGGGGRGFCANAFDAIMRGIPTQAARVMRRNPN